MIATWMIYTVAVALLLYAAAMGSEYVARALRLPTRFGWLLAMSAAVAFSGSALLRGPDASHPVPTTVSLPRSLRPETPAPIVSRRTTIRSAPVEISVARSRTIERSVGVLFPRIDVSTFDRWNRLLIVAWAAWSALLMAWLLVSLLRLRWLARRLTPGTVANRAVLISEDVGPALLGILRTRIVLPQWVLELPPTDQETIVTHERQHAAALDPALVCAGMCIVATQPWNAALWMLLARLRLAVEADCDRRVLGEEGDVRAYGQLLVEMYERTSGLSPHVAFAERASNLERRIRRITSRPRLFSGAVGASAIAAIVFATAAWKSPPPTRTASLLSLAAGTSTITASVLSTAPWKTSAPTRSSAASPEEIVAKSFIEKPVHGEPQDATHSHLPVPESLTVLFKQVVIAAGDSTDIARAARLADIVAHLLREGVAFDSLADRYRDFGGREVTGVVGPCPLNSLPLAYQKALTSAKIGDIVSFQVPGTSQRPEVPEFVVVQLIAIQQLELHVDPITGVPAPRSGRPQAAPTGVLAQTSPIRLTIISGNQWEIRFVPVDSTRRPVIGIGRAEFRWSPDAAPGYSAAEIMSRDTISQVHVEATQNGRIIASGEGAYLVVHRDSLRLVIEAWSHVPPPSSQGSAALSAQDTTFKGLKLNGVYNPLTKPRASLSESSGKRSDVQSVNTGGIEFPYPYYINNIVNEILKRFGQSRIAMVAEVRFVIRRDGSVDPNSIQLVKSSGVYSFDSQAVGAVESTANAKTFGALPKGYHNDILPITFRFSPHS